MKTQDHCQHCGLSECDYSHGKVEQSLMTVEERNVIDAAINLANSPLLYDAGSWAQRHALQNTVKALEAARAVLSETPTRNS